MDKEIVDQIITDYMKKIYGFAYAKIKNIDVAEDLSSRIIFEVYKSLLKKENVLNVSSYIYRVASNVYSQFIIDEFNEGQIKVNATKKTQVAAFNKDKTLSNIRKEIAYLSNIQREIIVMYYFEKLKQKEIAERLNISLANVKWHLFEAKNQMKEWFEEENKSELKTKKIIFSDIKRIGHINTLSIDISSFFKKSISQNIAYVAYEKPKTILEIARELDCPLAYVEDEMYHLVNNGFVDKVSANKYLTNMYITDINIENKKKIEAVLNQYIDYICDSYFNILFKTMKNYITLPNKAIYIPENDFNFLMWSIVSYACNKLVDVNMVIEKIDKYYVKTRDDGNYMVTAFVDKNRHISSDSNPQTHLSLVSCPLSQKFPNSYLKYYPEPMLILSWNVGNDKKPIILRAFSSEYSPINEKQDFITNMSSLNLYNFICGKFTNEATNIDNFISMFEDGSLQVNREVKAEKKPYVNLVVTTLSEKELDALLPPLPIELQKICRKIDDELFEINKAYFPAHKQDLCRLMNQNSLSKMKSFILECLIKKGKLKPVKKRQKKTVNMILFCDVLPD